MKENDNNSSNPSNPSGDNLGVWNDPELEARLVAMLMGELSPFEEAEMEQELERSPELRLFRDRVLEVQSLIAEVNQQDKQDKQSEYKEDWSLSDERRSRLLENFSEDKPERLQPEMKPADSSTSAIQWRNVFSIAACLLISLAAFMMMFLRKGKMYKSEAQMISYSAGSEIEGLMAESKSMPTDDRYFRSANARASDRDGKKGRDDSKSKFSYTEEAELEAGGFITKAKMNNEVKKKPSAPSSSMSKVIASNAPSPSAVAVPNESVAEPSLDFGNGDDFGDGWVSGSGKGGGGRVDIRGRGDSQDKGRELAQLDGLQKAQQNAQGDAFSDAEDSDPLGGKDVIWAANSEKQQNSKQDKEVKPIKESIKGELSKLGKLNDQLRVEAKSKTGYWREGGESTEDAKILKNGNRSGDFAIPKESIDNRLKELAEYDSTKGKESLVEAEIARRELQVAEGDKDVLKGRKAYSERNYEGAVEQYKLALEKLPQGPIAGDRRREYTGHLLEGSIALSQEYRRTGKYAEARGLLDDVLKQDPGNVVAKKHLEYLDDPIRTSPTLTYEHVEDVEKVRKLLYRGQSYYDQAKFEDATKEYKDVLRVDPYNKAARRGMEKVSAAKSDYYRAAYDQTRASMLMQVDQAWEIEVPPKFNDEILDGKLSNGLNNNYVGRDKQQVAKIEKIKELRKIQEDKVEDHRTRLYALSKRLQIPYHGKDAKFFAGSDSDASEHDRSDYAYQEAKRTKEQLESFTNSLNGLNDEDLQVTLLASGRPEAAVIKQDFDQLSELKQKKNLALAGEKEGKQKAINGLEASIKEIEGRLDRSTMNIRNKLAEDLVLFNENVEKLRLDSSKEEGDLMVGAEEKTKFGKVREDYERELAMLDAIRLKEFNESIGENLERDESEFFTREYKITPYFLSELRGRESGVVKLDSNKIQALLEKQGITFPAGAVVHYSSANGTLTMRNHGNSIDNLQDLVNNLKPAPKTTPDFSKEISAAEQTHSTFSLNVSDVSYQLAKSVLLEKGGMPEADKIRVEEFVNAFDYGDPGASGKKVNCVVEQCAHPFYQQRNLMRIGMKTGAMGRSQPLRLTVLLDNSGSMEREDRAATVVKAIEALASQLGPQDEVTLLSFARGARLVAQKVKGDQAHTLVDIVKAIPSEGGTNLSLAIEQAYTTAQQSVQEGAMSRIVLITDGAANLGNADPEDLSKSIERMRQNGIAFDACGVGADGLDDDMLEALTRKGDGRYYFINKPEDADAGFAQKLAGALRPAAKNVKVQVVFNPERVGNYRLVGFEKHRLKKEDFRNDAVDAAEMAAEEAGNALYQVEARPDGKGDVGTVFVRFQDMATGQMVERSWSIPYQPSIKNLTSAAPSMQLATVAGMLGERLKLGEEAGIEMNQLQPIYGKLRSHFHADKEVKDLIRMCEKVNR